MARAVKEATRVSLDRARTAQKALFDFETLELAPMVTPDGRRKSYARIPDILPMPSLIEVQLKSFRWFQEEGLRELFDEIFPIESLKGKMRLELVKYWFDEPKHSEEECRVYDMTYAAPLYMRARLVTETGERLEQDVYLGDFPLMTLNGTFVINGAERVVVSQLIRSSGIYFIMQEDRPSGRLLAFAKLIPNRGAWLEFETSKSNVLSVKVDRRRKLPVTLLLRAIAALDLPEDPHSSMLKRGTDEELLQLFAGSDSMPDHQYLSSTIARDDTKNAEEAIIEFFRKMRPGDPAKLENAKGYLTALLFNPRRYNLAKVGRYKLNYRLGLNLPQDYAVLSKMDLVKVVERMILVNNGVEDADDIDDLGNRRVKTAGELIQNQLRIGLLRLERVVRERMSTRDPEQMNPLSLINIRPVVAAIREFFGSSQLSQFMDQTNPLAELTHKRRLSALGPGGLRRERAGFDVRDVHHSHYGRICPIETPEGPNIGLIGSMATYARVNEYGFLETPYLKVEKSLPNDPTKLVGKTLGEDLPDRSGKVIAQAGSTITSQLAKEIAKLPREEIRIRPRVTQEVVYLSADGEEKYTIAQANAQRNEKGEFVPDHVSVRRGEEFLLEPVEEVDFMDVSPKQIVSVSAALIPFLEHDDANRALMGSNMQRQAVPLLVPEAPLVSTGIEFQAARDSGQVVVAQEDGEVGSVTSEQIVVRGKKGDRIYPLRRFNRSNQGTCIDQRPVVEKGQKVKRSEVLADSSSTEYGELALGRNVFVAFLSWEGGNYEDAVVVSESLVHDDKYTSVHIEKHELEARDTKLGPEEITRDIPNVGEEALKDLDEEGIVRIGAEVKPADILVGKITPKGETDLTPEEKLLRAIFGEKAREVKDSSLRLPHGAKGTVVERTEFTREGERELPPGVEKMVRVSIAQRRKLAEGDKMAGRHGNKGVISKVVPIADMPFLADGTPVEIILNPLGVPGRMNIGQILETHLGWACDRLGVRVVSPVFDGANEEEIKAELARAWLMDRAWEETKQIAWSWYQENGEEVNTPRDDQDVLLRYLAQALPKEEHKKFPEDEVLARRMVLREWLKSKGYKPEEILVFEKESRPIEELMSSDHRALELCLRLWLEDRGHSAAKLSGEALIAKAEEESHKSGWPLPIGGKMILYDGRTGEPFDQPVTVGVIYMMKLAHLVEDKVHARSTGPYSLVTQQPLGGKAQFGGQRFGEMEVWALEAYGAAYTLQEMLTVKSDDVSGRLRTYEAIVKGEPILEPGVPESFRVLVKELQSLALAIEVRTGEGAWVQFGKEESSERPSRPGLWEMGGESRGS